jgi:hypothetical protein
MLTFRPRNELAEDGDDHSVLLHRGTNIVDLCTYEGYPKRQRTLEKHLEDELKMKDIPYT